MKQRRVLFAATVALALLSLALLHFDAGAPTAEARGGAGVSPAPAYFLTAVGVESVVVTDRAGNNNGVIADSGLRRSLSGVAENVLGESAYLVSVPTSETYTITLRAKSASIYLEILTGADNTKPSAATRYRDIVLPAGVTAMLKTTPRGVERLRYDADANGTFETVIQPTASVSGAGARDLDGPQVSINVAEGQSSMTVSIGASDPSGVRAIYYSLDGSTFLPYAGSFNPGLAAGVYAFADDNVANRSGRTYRPLRVKQTRVHHRAGGRRGGVRDERGRERVEIEDTDFRIIDGAPFPVARPGLISIL